MFSVYFEHFVFFRADQIEVALNVALSLHATSNVPHRICVYDGEKLEEVCVLTSADKKRDVSE